MDDNHTLRSAHSNLSLRGERDTTTLRSPHSNITMRGDTGREEAVRHKMSQQTFINNEPEPMAHPVANPPEAARARKIYMSTIMGGTMMIIFIIFTIFSIYWGALYKTPSNTHKLVGWVVDFDQGVVGNAVTSAVQQLPYSPSKMTWVIKNASDFPGGPEDLANHVHQQHVWFAVSVNPGSSDALAAAIASPEQHTDYNGTLAITGYGEEARSENGYRTVLRPQFEALMEPIITRFTSQLVSQNISMLPEAQATAILRDAPQLVHRPVFYTLNNLRPFDIPVATAVTFVGLIYLLILSFLVTVISHTGREMSGYEHNLSTGKLIALRFATNIIIYFFLSLFYCLISIAFQAPFDRYLGKGGFVVYWMLQWIGMLALGFALETMITLMTNKFISIFLILWIIADVAVCFLPLELLPGVFRYGYAMPFYNVSQGVRVILFGTRNKLGLYFGVLLAWTGVSIITLPLSIILVRWLHARSEAKQKANPSPKDIDTEAPHTKHHASH